MINGMLDIGNGKKTYIGPFDLLAAFKTSEMDRLVELFGEEMRDAATYKDEAFLLYWYE